MIFKSFYSRGRLNRNTSHIDIPFVKREKLNAWKARRTVRDQLYLLFFLYYKSICYS